MRTEILKMFARRDGYISGEKISEALHISRAAVWKHINALKEDGCEIEAQTNKGYRLVRMPDLLKPEYIALYLADEPVKIVWLDSVDSTNTKAKELARETTADSFVVVTENQTGGKGRMGREWYSAPGEAVQMTIVVRPDIAPAKAPAFNMAAALGVCGAVQDLYGIEAGIKWPNDVVYQGKKLCGILTEMSADMDRVEYLACGIGVNANQIAFPGELKDRAVSLRMILGKQVERAPLSAALIGEVNKKLKAHLDGEGWLQQYKEHSMILEQEITVLNGEETVTGVCAGFGENGELLLHTDGKEVRFVAGEVSVRGMKSYV